MKLTQIRIFVKDFNRSVGVYRDVMQLETAAYVEEMQYASFHAGGVDIEIIPQADMAAVLGETSLPAEAERRSGSLLSFPSAQIDEDCAGLKSRGAVFINDPHDKPDWNARVAHFRDPDGNVLELYKHPL